MASVCARLSVISARCRGLTSIIYSLPYHSAFDTEQCSGLVPGVRDALPRGPGLSSPRYGLGKVKMDSSGIHQQHALNVVPLGFTQTSVLTVSPTTFAPLLLFPRSTAFGERRILMIYRGAIHQQVDRERLGPETVTRKSGDAGAASVGGEGLLRLPDPPRTGGMRRHYS